MRTRRGCSQRTSCVVAIDKIETLLRPLRERWPQRSSSGTLPADLASVLVQAELWGSQSTAVCRDDPAASRFAALRSLMTTIWRYPKQATRAELEQQLRVLGADQKQASTKRGMSEW
jgi:hypothetical protein